MKTKKKLSILLFFFAEIIAIERVGMAPFLSCDDFRNFCTFIVDEERKLYNPKNEPAEISPYFDPAQVKCGDTIFVNLAYLKRFFERYHPHIKHRYILVSNNHDFVAPGKFAQYVNDDHIYAWFTQNCDERTNPKVIPIPIGLLNAHDGGTQKKEMICNVLKELPVAKDTLLYANFNKDSNYTVRYKLLDFFSKSPFCKTAWGVSQHDYLLDIAKAKFVASPFGNGLDCYRIWEILYMKSFPIVLTSSMDRLFDDLPVLIVNDWTELTQEFLEHKYAQMSSKIYKMEKIYTHYWFNLISSYQKKCRESCTCITN